MFRKRLQFREGHGWLRTLSGAEEHLVWERFYEEFSFQPRKRPAIKEPAASVTWSLAMLPDQPGYERLDRLVEVVEQGLSTCVGRQGTLFALDWQHPSYRFAPQEAGGPGRPASSGAQSVRVRLRVDQDERTDPAASPALVAGRRKPSTYRRPLMVIGGQVPGKTVPAPRRRAAVRHSRGRRPPARRSRRPSRRGEAGGTGHVLAVARNHGITTRARKCRTDVLAKKTPERAWRKLSVGAGAGLGAKGQRASCLNPHPPTQYSPATATC
ncbi:DUF2716 domain-containing protein [Streptomyces globisporus]|uniref:DUF2716 domain-containing protein n=1 Tax=Streptomyces globisporus TaxID=1908 RepID=UPI001F37E906|nr:DUF2716 domain-containing protein [Streptomyces globisporus]